MEFQFEAKSKITLEHNEGEKGSRLVDIKYLLNIPECMEPSFYFNSEDLPTADGVKVVTQCFVQGLVANIHYAHEKGLRDSAEHLRYIIAELQRGFVEVPKMEISKY